MDKELRSSRLSEQLNKHYAAIAISKGLYCLPLRLLDDKCHWPTTIIHVCPWHTTEKDIHVKLCFLKHVKQISWLSYSSRREI